MSILGRTKLGITITGHSELVNLAIEQSEINVDIDPLLVDDELVERYIQCATHALPYFSVCAIHLTATVKQGDKLPLFYCCYFLFADTNRGDAICEIRVCQIFPIDHMEIDRCHWGCQPGLAALAPVESVCRNVQQLRIAGEIRCSHRGSLQCIEGTIHSNPTLLTIPETTAITNLFLFCLFHARITCHYPASMPTWPKSYRRSSSRKQNACCMHCINWARITRSSSISAMMPKNWRISVHVCSIWPAVHKGRCHCSPFIIA